MKFFVDVNIIIDLVLNRPEFVNDARDFLSEAKSSAAILQVASISVTTAFYLTRKLGNDRAAFDVVDYILGNFEVIAVDHGLLMAARKIAGRDFEDNVQMASAAHGGADVVVTRDAKGFQRSTVRVMNAAEALVLLRRPS